MVTVSATAANYVAQMNMLPMLNRANFKLWKENVKIVLGCMDLDNALRTEKSTSTQENLNMDKIEKRLGGSIVETTDAKLFLKELEQYFARNEKDEISQTLSKLINMRYKGKGNIREYIMEMSNIAVKLKALKLELPSELLMYLVIISLPAQYGQFV
ncbi:uncharacterized protein LOC133312765, partial [Gastrolobium bilobum]|uniref:uncharacterized protein LOC133312765 n=1 Tax=Gastrolobium bilobum TaxID=150636 RepID=UPI002AB2A447